jgi:hypothetical protein
MDNKDIIRMAMESGMTRVMDESSYRWLLEGKDPVYKVFMKFANLVAAAEREACAKIADNHRHTMGILASNPPQSAAAFDIAIDIRARGQHGD